MHFRSFAPFMAIAFAASAIAAPFASTRDLSGLGLGNDVASSASSEVSKVASSSGDIVSRQTEPVALHVIFQQASDKIQPIVVILQNNAQNQAQSNGDILMQNLQALKVALTELQTEVTTFAKYPVSVVESLAIVPAIVAALTPLLTLVFAVLVTVVQLVIATPVGTVVLPLVFDIVALVGAILAIVVGVVPQLLAALVPFLTTLVPSLRLLGVPSVLALLHA